MVQKNPLEGIQLWMCSLKMSVAFARMTFQWSFINKQPSRRSPAASNYVANRSD